MRQGLVSQSLALFALGLLIALVLWPPTRPWNLLGALPLVAVFLAGLRPTPHWGGWVAVVMIPYLSIGVMNLLAGPATPVVGLLMACGSTLACLSALDWTRRMGFSLRR